MGKELTLYKKVDISNQIVETQRTKIQRLEEVKQGLGKIVEQLMHELQRYRNMEKENLKYKEMYGDFDVPFLIWKEMCRSGQIKVEGIAIPPKEFKHPAIKQTKQNKHHVTFWVSLFEQWGLVDNFSSRHYILKVPWRKGKYIIKRNMEKINGK